MRKNVGRDEEDRLVESADSDRYSLDNLDLLNLRISFSSDDTNKAVRRNWEKSRVGFANSECLPKKDHRPRHAPQRCEHYRKNIRESGDYVHPERGVPSSRHIKAPKEQHVEREDRSVLLLYSNRDRFPKGTLHRSSSEICLENRKRQDEPPTHIVDIRTVSHNKMAHRSVRKASKQPQPQPGEQGGAFPFKMTPSGNFKVNSQQVVFESQKLSVLVADPQNTKVNIHADPQPGNMPPRMTLQDIGVPKSSAMESLMGQNSFGSLGSLLACTAPARREKESSEYDDKVTDEILDPELNLSRLGYTASEPIDWVDVKLPEKTNLYLELYQRITNYTNADCKVYIDNEEFNCHLIVLQCYSEVFDEYVAVKKVELPSDKVTPAAFAFIYEWMITGEPAYMDLNRETVLDIFNAAKYLKIKDLTEQCWAFIDNTDVFSEDTAFLLYMDARYKDLEDVRELMLPRIQKFFLMLVSSEDWLELDKQDVVNLLSSNYICVNCEMEIFMSAIRWLKHKLEERQADILEVMACVRFGNIAPWQLVDIKRNPENPDFLKLTSVPAICKMIDDGLAFVIIKYWYGQENDDFQHWNSILGLQEPPARNWSGMDKTYFTYREFLIYLDQYRRSQMMEKTKPKEKKRKSVDMRTSPHGSYDRVSPRIPTMDEFLSNRNAVGGEKLQRKVKRRQARGDYLNVKQPNLIFHATKPRSKPDEIELKRLSKREYVAAPKIHATRRDYDISKHGTKREHEAATVIQATFRGHLVRQVLRKYMPELRVRSFRERPRLVPKQRTSTFRRTSSDFPWNNNQSNVKVLSMFEQSMRPKHRWNEMSASALPPFQKDYNYELSLFNVDRESVLVFGGIDPHNTYGVSRNTGKDVFRYVPNSNTWEYVGDLPEPRHHHSVAFLKGRVYLCGGADPREDDVRGKSVVVDTVWSFEPVRRAWFSEGSLNTPRKNFGLVPSNYSLYAIGGQDRQGRTLASVERMVPETGLWEFLAPLKYPRMGVACAKYRDFIWAVGGMSGSKKNPLSDTVECYDVKTNQWTEITKLRFPRCFSRIFNMSDRLYLIGGAGKLTEKEKTTTSVSAIDVWDSVNNEWKHHTDMAIPRHGHATAYLGTQILIIGGVTTVYMRALTNAECYCTERGTWVRGIACLPSSLSGHAAVTLPPASLM